MVIPDKRSLSQGKGGSYPTGVFLRCNHIVLPKIGEVKINKHRAVHGKLKSATITKERTGKWYVSLLFEDNHVDDWGFTGSIVGVDMNIGDIVLSDGAKYEVPKFTKNNADELVYRQRIFSRSQRALTARRKNGENLNKCHIKNYQEKRQDVAHVHATIAVQGLISFIKSPQISSRTTTLSVSKP